MKSGFIALIGRPNAGKSTLINALLDQKIAIISDKPQTTRNQIRGIRTDDDSQIIFIDTPGIHKPQHALGTQMNKEAFNAAGGVDLLFLIVDASVEFGTGDEFVLNIVKKYKLPTFLILNKIDLIKKDELIKIIGDYNSKHEFAEIIPISAFNKTNMDELLKVTKDYLEEQLGKSVITKENKLEYEYYEEKQIKNK